jgi:hypothetical protein
LGPRLDVFADPQSTHSDGAIDRGSDRRVSQVEFCLALARLLLSEHRVGLGEFRLEDVNLLLGCCDNRAIVLLRSVLLANVGLR